MILVWGCFYYDKERTKVYEKDPEGIIEIYCIVRDGL